jgi:uncharacterized Zn finger protein (UPF0148 family)
MQCEVCGDSISRSNAHRRDGQVVCPDCHAEAKQEEATARQKQQQQRQREPPPQQSQTREQTAPSRQRSPDRRQPASSDSGGRAKQQDKRQTRSDREVPGSPTKRLENSSPPANRSSNGAEGQGTATGAPAEQKFNALRRFGKFIAGCGWVLIGLSVVCALLTIGAGELNGMMVSRMMEGMARVSGFFASVFAAMLGLMMVVIGQQASCFAAIERNTRSTYELIRAQQD